MPKDPQIPWTVWLWKGPLKWVGNALLIGGILGTLVHYLKYGPAQTEEAVMIAPIPHTKSQRFTLSERLIHWIVALAFLYAALTGLSLWSPRLYWLAAVFGGGVTVRAWHPLGGLIFVAVFSAMFISWKRHMRLDSDDRRWLRLAHRYAAHDYGCSSRSRPLQRRAEVSFLASVVEWSSASSQRGRLVVAGIHVAPAS